MLDILPISTSKPSIKQYEIDRIYFCFHVIGSKGAGRPVRFRGRGLRTRIRARGAAVRAGRNAPTLQSRERIREVPGSVLRKLSGCEGARDSRAADTRARR